MDIARRPRVGTTPVTLPAAIPVGLPEDSPEASAVWAASAEWAVWVASAESAVWVASVGRAVPRARVSCPRVAPAARAAARARVSCPRVAAAVTGGPGRARCPRTTTCTTGLRTPIETRSADRWRRGPRVRPRPGRTTSTETGPETSTDKIPEETGIEGPRRGGKARALRRNLHDRNRLRVRLLTATGARLDPRPAA